MFGEDEYNLVHIATCELMHLPSNKMLSQMFPLPVVSFSEGVIHITITWIAIPITYKLYHELWLHGITVCIGNSTQQYT